MESTSTAPVKVHRRHVALDGRACTVLTLRPSTPHRFATNRYHQTWHVLTDVGGARLIGRLCWALAYQRRPGTLVVIDGPLLVPNPFDADPSSPIVIANANLTPLKRTAVAQLKRFVARSTPSDGTVRLYTAGLDRLLAADPDRDLRERHTSSGVWWDDRQRRSWTDCVNGVVVMAAPPPVLQWWAVWCSRLGERWHHGSDHAVLDHPTARRGDGEVQVFEDFGGMVDRAVERRELLFPGSARSVLSDDQRRTLWDAMPT